MRNLLIAGAIFATACLSACSPSSSSPSSSTSGTVAGAVQGASGVDHLLATQGIKAELIHPLTQAQYDTVVHQGNGFLAGLPMARDVAYVFFDPQCPHCGVLWQSSLPLQHSTQIHWMPVAFLNADSLPQAAALLGASDGAALMASHEESMAQRQGGLNPGGTLDPALASKVRANMDLLGSLDGTSVPFVVHRSADGTIRAIAGELTTDQLKAFLGS